jgi:hypothetical protein
MTISSEPLASLEQALADLEGHAESTVRALMAAVKAAKRAKNTASAGLLRDVQQAIDSAAELAGEAAASAADLRDEWRFDAGAYFESGGYTKELLVVAEDAGLQAFELDDRILSYPSIVSVSPADTTVVIDKKKDRKVRPSVVVGHLAALQQRPLRFRPQLFIETLAKAYDLVATRRPGATVKLVDVYAVLTLLPGLSRDYTKPEFARDLYLLDQSGVTSTKDGRQMTLPASALTRGTGVLQTVTRGGQIKVYAGISFDRPTT